MNDILGWVWIVIRAAIWLWLLYLAIDITLLTRKLRKSIKEDTERLNDIMKLITKENVDRCVCCGNIIPEGRAVCPDCEAVIDEFNKIPN